MSTTCLHHMITFIALSVSSPSYQVLAVFRFLCLQVGYAAFRLKHWWVIAVSERSNVMKYCKMMSSAGNTDPHPPLSADHHSSDQCLPRSKGHPF